MLPPSCAGLKKVDPPCQDRRRPRQDTKHEMCRNYFLEKYVYPSRRDDISIRLKKEVKSKPSLLVSSLRLGRRGNGGGVVVANAVCLGGVVGRSAGLLAINHAQATSYFKKKNTAQNQSKVAKQKIPFEHKPHFVARGSTRG